MIPRGHHHPPRASDGHLRSIWEQELDVFETWHTTHLLSVSQHSIAAIAQPMRKDNGGRMANSCSLWNRLVRVGRRNVRGIQNHLLAVWLR